MLQRPLSQLRLTGLSWLYGAILHDVTSHVTEIVDQWVILLGMVTWWVVKSKCKPVL
jgi:hypothetical protein